MNETQRIKEAYAKRDLAGKGKLYSSFNIASLYSTQQREKAIIDLLKRFRMHDLSGKRILDVGCGNGGVLRDFLKYGAMPENLSGVDLLPDRIDAANRLSPNMDFRCLNAESLPYEDGSFDMVISFTVASSILDGGMKQNLADEMLRVLRRGGVVLWYDYYIDNPRNPDVKGIKKKEILRLFSGCDVYLKRITLAPPLSRAIAPMSYILCAALEKIPVLCTHYLGAITKASA